jgi:hypothetical protein
MTRGIHTPLVVDSKKLIKEPTKEITQYSEVVDTTWVYSPVMNEVAFSRTMTPNFNLITGLDPWGRKFVKSIFYNENREVDKIATWRILSSITQHNQDKNYVIYGYTTVHGEVVKLRVTEVDDNDLMFLLRPHFVTHKQERDVDDRLTSDMPAYIV